MGAYETAVAETELLATVLPSGAWSNAYAVDRPSGTPTDPQRWLTAMMRRPPLWVVPALGLRQLLALSCGIRPPRRPRRTTDRELLTAVDTGAFDCHVSLRCDDDRVVLTTVGTPHNARGRLFLAVAGRAHPAVARAVLVKAAAVLAGRGSEPGVQGAASGTT